MDSTDLKILRMQYSGLSPEFAPEIKDYYFVVDGSVNRINITAIPKYEEAIVKISGNENLKYGLNLIRIEVKNNEELAVYNIRVTKTDSLEKANANLETLAIRQGKLVPEFDYNVTNYDLEVANNIYRAEVLAIPQSKDANVETRMSDELVIGYNKIEVVVLAEDGITEKVYKINVYRRSIEEDIEFQQQIEVNAERLSAILSKDSVGYNYNVKQLDRNRNNWIGIIVVSLVVVILLAMFVYFVRKKK